MTPRTKRQGRRRTGHAKGRQRSCTEVMVRQRAHWQMKRRGGWRKRRRKGKEGEATRNVTRQCPRRRLSKTADIINACPRPRGWLTPQKLETPTEALESPSQPRLTSLKKEYLTWRTPSDYAGPQPRLTSLRGEYLTRRAHSDYVGPQPRLTSYKEYLTRRAFSDYVGPKPRLTSREREYLTRRTHSDYAGPQPRLTSLKREYLTRRAHSDYVGPRSWG